MTSGMWATAKRASHKAFRGLSGAEMWARSSARRLRDGLPASQCAGEVGDLRNAIGCALGRNTALHYEADGRKISTTARPDTLFEAFARP